MWVTQCIYQLNYSIYLGYHTLNQVIVGSLVGVGFGLIWYSITKLLHSFGIIDWILDLPVAKKLYIRDMGLIDNVARFEYEQWDKLRQKKLKNKVK
jgi:dolichyldiphosphatase